MMDLDFAQSYMRSSRIDGWLLYDFRGSNPFFARLTGGRRPTTRRCALFVPQSGTPRLLVHPLDHYLFAESGIEQLSYVNWQQFHDQLRALRAGCDRVAMEYSPGAALPAAAYVDAGTVELIRSFGSEVVSSADLAQAAVARWSDRTYRSHLAACRLVEQIKDRAFALIGQRVRDGASITEHDVQAFIVEQFRASGLVTDHAPIVAVNANSGNPHYAPSEQRPVRIRRGDWVLIDLWAKLPDPIGAFGDITWVGIVGTEPSELQRTVFETVKCARDAVVQRLRSAWDSNEVLSGWQLDDVARGIIADAGYRDRFIHRTGHNIGPGEHLHGLGVNLDNLETHDTRNVIPGVGFSVEPGIYLPEFGVRLEVNVYVDPAAGPTVTTAIQDEIIRVGV